MYLPFGSVVAAVAILISIASAANIQARDDVALCKAVLIALKASAFCSSFVPITDKVSTVSSPGTTTQSTVTVIVTGTQCNYKPKKKRTQAVSTAATPKPTTTSSTKCSIKGISPQLNIFACEIIKAACQAYVKPKTTTTTAAGGTITQPPSTITFLVPRQCGTDINLACSGGIPYDPAASTSCPLDMCTPGNCCEGATCVSGACTQTAISCANPTPQD